MSEGKFKQIAETIESRIDQGIYPANSKLPAHRQLADELGTTPATVSKAYKLLAEKNRLESFVGRGTFVCGESKLEQVIHAPEDDNEFNFSILQPCLKNNTPYLQQAFAQASQKLTPEMFGYVEHSGHLRHREAGVQWAKEYGLAGGNADNTLLVNGAQHALSLLISLLTKSGDTIVVESLTYPGILAIASLSGRHVVGVEQDKMGICPDSLQQAIRTHNPKLLITVPSHQNPTGVTMSVERRKAIAEIVMRSNLWLIEDDIYGFLNSEPIEAVSNWAAKRSFHITSLSKALSPALRCGFIKVPEAFVAEISAHIRANIWLSSPLNYMVASDMVASGMAFKLASLQKDLAKQRQAIANQILNTQSTHLTGYHIWLSLPSYWNCDRFVMQAKDQGIIVSSGSYFSAEAKESNHIRLSLMAIADDNKLKAGIEKLQQLISTNASSLLSSF